MATTELIAAVELGSSKIRGMVGKKNIDGNLVILAYASENSSSFIHKGIIYNLDKAVGGLKSIINRLESTSGKTIDQIYVGICGQSFRSVANVVSRDLREGDSVTEELVDSISDENHGMKLEDLDVLDVITQEYHIGSVQPTLEPVGILTKHIDGHFLNIVARSIIKKNLSRCFEEARVKIADDPFIIPLVNADYVLSERERRLGCALVDFGSDVTTVAVYRKNLLRYLSVIPIGSSSITHDLTALNVDEDEAEDLKCRYGSATFDSNKEEDETIHLRDNDRTIQLSQIFDIVEARTEEIVANVWNQISYSNLEGLLGAGFIFTGGGANLRNLSKAFCNYKQQNVPVRVALSIYDQVVTSTGVVFPNDGTQNALLSMLLKGKENCCEIRVIKKDLFDSAKEETPHVEQKEETQNEIPDEPIKTSPEEKKEEGGISRGVFTSFFGSRKKKTLKKEPEPKNTIVEKEEPKPAVSVDDVKPIREEEEKPSPKVDEVIDLVVKGPDIKLEEPVKKVEKPKEKVEEPKKKSEEPKKQKSSGNFWKGIKTIGEKLLDDDE